MEENPVWVSNWAFDAMVGVKSALLDCEAVATPKDWRA